MSHPKGKAKEKTPTHSDGDGKGEDSSQARSAALAATPSSAAQTLASALRTTMASSQLGSLMQSASGGKPHFAPSSGSGGDLRDWLVQDLRSPSSPAGSTSAAGLEHGSRAKAFRSTPIQSDPNPEHLFDQFQRGMALNTGATSHEEFSSAGGAFNHASDRWQTKGLDPSIARPIQSYTELDSSLHESVRNDHRASPNDPRTDRSYQPSVAAPLAQTDDIFALLDAEQLRSEPAFAQHTVDSSLNARHNQTDPSLSHHVLSHFDQDYRPPSPSNTGFSREQAALHLQLAEAQASEQGTQQLAVPRPDNASTNEGVYATTAEEALKSIFEGRQESTDVVEEQDHAAEVVRKITRWFAASSYLDDVYGLPPLLKETIEEAARPKSDDKTIEENRQKAVRRLESLWNHLSNTPPQANANASDWVDSWLRTNA